MTTNATARPGLVVVHGATPFGRALTLALAKHGAPIGVVGATGDEPAVAAAIRDTGGTAVACTSTLDTRGAYEATLADVAAEVDGVGTVVAPVLPGRTGPNVRRALADLPEDEWVTECELPMRAARFAVQAAFTTFAGEGGRVVLVAPTAALTGEPGLAAYSTAAEASRAMVRAVARGWGAHGITLHWVGAPTALFTGEDPSSAPRMAMWDHALGGPATIDDVAAVVWSLATPTTAALTGTTTIVDGGLVMPV